MPTVYWSADGAGKVGEVPDAIFKWIRRKGEADLIVYGGDVYNRGKPKEFKQFLEQLGGDVSDLCETPGNHDWKTVSESPATGEIPSGYEEFWSGFAPPASAQPIDTTKRGGARYEHFRDLGGWRLIFLDTGPCEDHAWPMGDAARAAWLSATIKAGPGRRQIVFAHHSRLSRGKHGDNDGVDAVWQALFDPATGKPLVALTVSGHDHNVSVYGPRPLKNPGQGSVAFTDGVHVVVNGAGGEGHDAGFRGTEPDMFFDDDHFCISRIRLLPNGVDMEILSFGRNDPPTKDEPKVLMTLPIRL